MRAVHGLPQIRSATRAARCVPHIDRHANAAHRVRCTELQAANRSLPERRRRATSIHTSLATAAPTQPTRYAREPCASLGTTERHAIARCGQEFLRWCGRRSWPPVRAIHIARRRRAACARAPARRSVALRRARARARFTADARRAARTPRTRARAPCAGARHPRAMHRAMPRECAPGAAACADARAYIRIKAILGSTCRELRRVS